MSSQRPCLAPTRRCMEIIFAQKEKKGISPIVCPSLLAWKFRNPFAVLSLCFRAVAKHKPEHKRLCRPLAAALFLVSLAVLGASLRKQKVTATKSRQNRSVSRDGMSHIIQLWRLSPFVLPFGAENDFHAIAKRPRLLVSNLSIFQFVVLRPTPRWAGGSKPLQNMAQIRVYILCGGASRVGNWATPGEAAEWSSGETIPEPPFSVPFGVRRFIAAFFRGRQIGRRFQPFHLPPRWPFASLAGGVAAMSARPRGPRTRLPLGSGGSPGSACRLR